MFELLPRSSHAHSSRRGTFRPQLECLEQRDCPTTLMSIGSGGISVGSLSMAVTYNEEQSVTLYGWLTDVPNPGSQPISISGVADGFTSTNAFGYYTITLEANELGNVEAEATVLAITSEAQTLTSNAPVINDLQGLEGPLNSWTFNGDVDDESVEGLTVNFGGIPSLEGKSTTTDAQGGYTLAATLSGDSSDNGTAWAEVTDWWGLSSEKVFFVVHQTGT